MKLLNLEQKIMKTLKTLTQTAFVGLATLTLGVTATVARAEKSQNIVVTRGPGLAPFVVKADNIPLDAQRVPQATTPTHLFPKLENRGHGNAPHIINAPSNLKPDTQAQSRTFPNLITQGSHGAAAIAR